MNENTKNKFAEILAAAQKQTGAKVTTTKEIKQPEEIKKVFHLPEVADLKEVEKSKMVSFFIHWSETPGAYDQKVLTTWKEANEAMKYCFDANTGDGYTKVKITVKWANGKEITDRIDCGNCGGDFNANNETIGQYLSKQNSTMYAGNLQQGERTFLSFEDEPQTEKPEVKQDVKLKVIDYSEKAFAITGDTKQIKDKLKELGGRFNYHLTCGAGWIFPKAKAYTVRRALNLV